MQTRFESLFKTFLCVYQYIIKSKLLQSSGSYLIWPSPNFPTLPPLDFPPFSPIFILFQPHWLSFYFPNTSRTPSAQDLELCLFYLEYFLPDLAVAGSVSSFSSQFMSHLLREAFSGHHRCEKV